jgi:hypothetical protein
VRCISGHPDDETDDARKFTKIEIVTLLSLSKMVCKKWRGEGRKFAGWHTPATLNDDSAKEKVAGIGV